MKNLIVLLLFCSLSFSQEKKRTLDERINTSLDSLSKLYKKKVYSFGYVSYRGVKKTHIRYIENGKEITEVVKTENIGIKKADDN
jgi:hypothetical protein